LRAMMSQTRCAPVRWSRAKPGQPETGAQMVTRRLGEGTVSAHFTIGMTILRLWALISRQPPHVLA
jgi:hypothetical protein